MTLIKVYDVATGHVETVMEVSNADPVAERVYADLYVTSLVSQDHGTDTVYYCSQEEGSA